MAKARVQERQVSSVNLPDRELHEGAFGHAGAGLGQIFGGEQLGTGGLKPDAGSHEAHEFGAGIGVERDALLHILGFGNPRDDVGNAQRGLADRGG